MELNKLRKGSKLYRVTDILVKSDDDLLFTLQVFKKDKECIISFFEEIDVLSKSKDVLYLSDAEEINLQYVESNDKCFGESISDIKYFYKKNDAIDFFNNMIKKYQERHNEIIKMCYYGQPFFKDIEKLGVLGSVIKLEKDKK